MYQWERELVSSTVTHLLLIEDRKTVEQLLEHLDEDISTIEKEDVKAHNVSKLVIITISVYFIVNEIVSTVHIELLAINFILISNNYFDS